MPKRAETIGTINQIIATSIRSNPAAPALTAKFGKEWRSLTYSEIGERLRRFSIGLRALGIERGDRVAILSENRLEWAIADLGALAMGAVTVPIYPNLPPAQVAHILGDSGARAIVASDAKQIAKVLAHREQTLELSVVVAMDSAAEGPGIVTFDHVLDLGEKQSGGVTPSFDQLRDSIGPDDLATFVYTSGTTGDPKGAMLTQGNLYAATQFARDAFIFDTEREIFLSFLPLCHVFERVTYYLALGLGVNTYYAESIFKVRDNILEVRPTIMQCVPRLFQTLHEGVNTQIAKEPAARRRLIDWSIREGTRHALRTNAGKVIWPVGALRFLIAERLVLRKLRERLGGRLRFFVSGGAPLPVHTAEFLLGIGIPVVEGYGLTETTSGVSINRLGRIKIGTVGRLLGTTKFKLASDGEILVSGATIMKGYWNHPEATAQAIDSDGWLHTGDIGEIDRDGYVRITDRKKDIIVLANGKKVAPQPIESVLKASNLVSEVILLGDESGMISALVAPDYQKLAEWARQAGISDTSPTALAGNVEARKAVKREIDALSEHLAEYEKVRRIALLDHALTIEAGELTPTLKVRRRIVQERYGHLLDQTVASSQKRD